MSVHREHLKHAMGQLSLQNYFSKGADRITSVIPYVTLSAKSSLIVEGRGERLGITYIYIL